MWRIYYSDRVVEGATREEWEAAPSTDVQVVVRLPRELPIRWFYTLPTGENKAVTDRDLWTGDDWFDPFGWGAKEGRLLSDADYMKVWEAACGD